MKKECVKRTKSKWRAKKCYRGIQFRETMRMKDSKEPAWAAEEEAREWVWGDVWYCKDWELWKLMAYCLHVLFDIFHFWDIDAKEHSSTWFAMAWSQQERISEKHMNRLKSKPGFMANRQNIAGQLIDSHEQASNSERWKHAMMADVEKHLEHLVMTKIWSETWQQPKGENDDNWRHWDAFQQELQPWKGCGIKWNWLRSQAWSIFMRQLKTIRKPKGSIAVELMNIKVMTARYLLIFFGKNKLSK